MIYSEIPDDKQYGAIHLFEAARKVRRLLYVLRCFSSQHERLGFPLAEDGAGKRAGLMQRRGHGVEESDSEEEGFNSMSEDSDAELTALPEPVPQVLVGTKRAEPSSTPRLGARARKAAAAAAAVAADEPAAKRQRAMDCAELRAVAEQSKADLGITGVLQLPTIVMDLCQGTAGQHTVSSWDPPSRSIPSL